MNTQPAAVPIPEGQGGGNPAGREKPKEGLSPATLGAILKLTKTKELFVRFEIGFKRTTPRYPGLAAEAQAPHGEPVAPQPKLAFSAAAPRPAPALLDAAAALPGAGGAPASSSSGSSLFVQLKGGVSVTPPDGYPPPP
jgi:hypothetical protein